MAIQTIIRNFENISIDKQKSAQLILKFNSELKKLGFGEVIINGYEGGRENNLNPDIIREKLTLYFMPNYDNINYIERQYFRDSFSPITTHLNSLAGSDSLSYYFALRDNTFEEQIKLKINFNGKDYPIGDYLPTRNIVIIYFSPFLRRWELNKENQYIMQLLDWIKDVCQTNFIKERNVNELKDKIFIAKFTKVIQEKIRDTQYKEADLENQIEKYRREIATWCNELTLGQKAVTNLKLMLDNIKESLLEKIEEIKKLKFVKKIELTQEGIILEFEKIFIKVKGEDIEMGDYIIKLLPNDIRIENKEPVEYGNHIYHSCHISNDKICFGNEKTLAYELLGRMELKKLAHFLFLYLKSYNPDDTYLSMNYWILGKKNGGVVPTDDDGNVREDGDEHGDEEYCDNCGEWVDEDNFDYDANMCVECRDDREETEEDDY